MKKTNWVRNIGIALIIIQILVVFGSVIDKSFDIYLVHNFGELIQLIVYFWAAIIGGLLILLSYKLKK